MPLMNSSFPWHPIHGLVTYNLKWWQRISVTVQRKCDSAYKIRAPFSNLYAKELALLYTCELFYHVTV